MLTPERRKKDHIPVSGLESKGCLRTFYWSCMPSYMLVRYWLSLEDHLFTPGPRVVILRGSRTLKWDLRRATYCEVFNRGENAPKGICGTLAPFGSLACGISNVVPPGTSYHDTIPFKRPQTMVQTSPRLKPSSFQAEVTAQQYQALSK